MQLNFLIVLFNKNNQLHLILYFLNWIKNLNVVNVINQYFSSVNFVRTFEYESKKQTQSSFRRSYLNYYLGGGNLLNWYIVPQCHCQSLIRQSFTTHIGCNISTTQSSEEKWNIIRLNTVDICELRQDNNIYNELLLYEYYFLISKKCILETRFDLFNTIP